MVAATKGTRMNTKALAVAASLWVPMVATAASETSIIEQQEALSARLEQILAKNGISLGGQFRGEVGASILGGNSQNTARRDDEQIGFTSVDFDLRARPNTYTTARAVFRLHLDHSAFFGSPYTPFESRWLSLDGGAADILYYHFGSLNQKWSPYTINSTLPGFLFTPRIFADQQKLALAERFINEGRNLQGLNLGVRAAVPAAQIDSFDVSLLAAKLLSAAPVGSPKSQFISNSAISGDGTTGYPDTLANFDRWTMGAKGDVTFMKAFRVGANFLATQDLRSTYGSTDTTASATRFVLKRVGKADSTYWTLDIPNYTRDSILQTGNVVSATMGADVAKFLGNSNLIAALDIDFARSAWQYYSDASLVGPIVSTNDTVGTGAAQEITTTSIGRFAPVYTTKNGVALNVGVTGGWSTDMWTVKAKAGFIQVDSLFRSDLAQTAVFNNRFGRIYNTEQDALFSHYNVFDAMYHTVHRWVAEEKNEYAKNPYDKIAYSNYVAGQITPSLGEWTAATKFEKNLSRVADSSKLAAEAKMVASKLKADSVAFLAASKSAATSKASFYNTALYDLAWDRDVQLVLPAGEASANRVGPKFGLDFDLMQGGVEVKLNGYMLQEAKASVLDSFNQVFAEKAKFQQVQAGTRIRADKFISGWKLPIEVTGSFGLSTAKGGTALDYASTSINAGLYVGLIKRLSLLAGYQSIKGEDKAFGVNRNESNLAGGIEFKIQEGAALVAMLNQLKTEFPNATEFNFDQNIWSTKIAVSF
jgi:hypothetical protein